MDKEGTVYKYMQMLSFEVELFKLLSLHLND